MKQNITDEMNKSKCHCCRQWKKVWVQTLRDRFWEGYESGKIEVITSIKENFRKEMIKVVKNE